MNKINYRTIARSFHIGRIIRTGLTVLFILSILTIASAHGSGLSSAKAVAMGGAQMGLAKGITAPLFNPANLGLNGYRKTGIGLVGAGAQISNNSFTLNDYNEYTGALLTESDKTTILNKIPVDGLKIMADVETSAMTISMGSFVLSFNGYAATDVNLGRDALRLFLNGVDFDDAFNLDGMYSEAIAYASAGLSYGMPIYTSGTRQLSVGTTIKYIRGFGYEEVTEISGGVSTHTYGFEGEGTMKVNTSTGGTGYGVDIGAALKLSNSYTLGASITNIVSKINWDKETKEYGYYFQFDTLSVDNMDDDSLVVTEDYDRDIDAFSSGLPSILRLGLANTTGKLIWAVDWEQGFHLGAGVTTKPRFAFGAEYKLIGPLPFRGGFATGGGKGQVISGGTGLDIGVFYLDLALSNHSGFNFNETKGFHFAVSTGLNF
jgi:uncharacterized protein DUF5723